MGPEIALALAAGGTGLQIAGANRVRNEQRDIMNRQLERTNTTLDNTTGQLLAEGKNYAPGQRLQDMQAQENGIFSQSQKDLAGAGAGDIPTAGGMGNVPQEFLRAKADRVLSEGNRMSSIARELAKVHAPGQLMAREGMRRADVTGRVGSQWGATRRLGEAAQQDASGVEEPWWSQAGKLAAMAGMAGMMGGAGAGGGAATGGGGLIAHPGIWG